MGKGREVKKRWYSRSGIEVAFVGKTKTRVVYKNLKDLVLTHKTSEDMEYWISFFEENGAVQITQKEYNKIKKEFNIKK